MSLFLEMEKKMSYVVLCTALLLTLFRIGKEAAALLPILFPVKCSTFSVFSLEVKLLHSSLGIVWY